MYICKDCGQLFIDPQECVENYELNSPPYESFKGCPKCSGTYNTALKCDNCNQYIIGEFVRTADSHIYCENCYTLTDIVRDEI